MVCSIPVFEATQNRHGRLHRGLLPRSPTGGKKNVPRPLDGSFFAKQTTKNTIIDGKGAGFNPKKNMWSPKNDSVGSLLGKFFRCLRVFGVDP